MILAMAVLLFQFPVAGVAANAPQPPKEHQVPQAHAAPVTISPSASGSASDKSSASDDHVARPILRTVALPAEFSESPMTDVYLPPPPAFRPPDEAPVTHRRSWIFLSALEHSSAGFDAWSTRRALSSGRVEADPLMRPFAGSAAIYGAIQVIPIGLDYVARRFQRSSGWTHRIWWAPQAIASATFLFSGSYNVAHTN